MGGRGALHRAASPNLEPRHYAQRGRDGYQRPGDGGLDITWGFNEYEPSLIRPIQHDPNADPTNLFLSGVSWAPDLGPLAKV
jgi:hypothetical protein